MSGRECGKQWSVSIGAASSSGSGVACLGLMGVGHVARFCGGASGLKAVGNMAASRTVGGAQSGGGNIEY